MPIAGLRREADAKTRRIRPNARQAKIRDLFREKTRTFYYKISSRGKEYRQLS
jgi:hypothetical protein